MRRALGVLQQLGDPHGFCGVGRQRLETDAVRLEDASVIGEVDPLGTSEGCSGEDGERRVDERCGVCELEGDVVVVGADEDDAGVEDRAGGDSLLIRRAGEALVELGHLGDTGSCPVGRVGGNGHVGELCDVGGHPQRNEVTLAAPWRGGSGDSDRSLPGNDAVRAPFESHRSELLEVEQEFACRRPADWE